MNVSLEVDLNVSLNNLVVHLAHPVLPGHEAVVALEVVCHEEAKFRPGVGLVVLVEKLQAKLGGVLPPAALFYLMGLGVFRVHQSVGLSWTPDAQHVV